MSLRRIVSPHLEPPRMRFSTQGGHLPCKHTIASQNRFGTEMMPGKLPGIGSKSILAFNEWHVYRVKSLSSNIYHIFCNKKQSSMSPASFSVSLLLSGEPLFSHLGVIFSYVYNSDAREFLENFLWLQYYNFKSEQAIGLNLFLVNNDTATFKT